MPATASDSRIIRLMSRTSSISTSPGRFPARNSSTRSTSGVTARSAMPRSPAIRLRKSRWRRTSWSNTAMLPLVM